MRKRRVFLALCLALFSKGFSQIELRSVSDALKIALANDAEHSLQRLGAEESVRMSKKNITGFLPVLDFSLADAARAQIGSDDSKNKSIEVGVTQKIFNGGKSFLEWQMQKEKSFYQFLSVQKSCENFKNSVMKAYYNAILFKLKSELLKSALKNAEQILLAAELEEAEGMITKTEYLETLLECKKIQLEAKSAADDFDKGQTELKRIMNVSQGQKLVLSESESFERALDDCFLIEGLREKSGDYKQSSVQNSLDLKLCAAELNWAKKKRSLQKRCLLPSVSVRGGVSFSGRNYPLTSPSYSIKVILSFEDNPWINASASQQIGFNKGKMNSISNSISGQGILNTSYFSQMRLNRIEIAQKKLSVEQTKKAVEENVVELIKKIENVQENFLLNLESAKIKEQKLALSMLLLEQGRKKKSDCIEEMNECAKQKIQCLVLLKERDYLAKELESMAALKL